MGNGGLVFDLIMSASEISLYVCSLRKVCGASKVLHKAAFFFRTAAWNSILTLVNLIRRKVVVINRCPMFRCN